MAIFRKPKGPENLRRRFHHFLLKKKREIPKGVVERRPRVRAQFMARTGLGKIGRWLVRVGLLVGVFAAVFGLFYLLFFSPVFIVQSVVLDEEPDIPSLRQITETLESLKGKNILLLDTSRLEQDLQQKFPNEILLLRIRKRYPQRIRVEIDAYPIVANVKNITAKETQNFLVNQIGYAVKEKTEDPKLPIIVYRTEKPLKFRTVILEKKILESSLLAITTYQDTLGMKVTDALYLPIERELHLHTEKNFYVWLDLQRNLEGQLQQLKRALPKLDIYHEPLEYIDLRIAASTGSDKVIFKRKR